MGGSPPTCATHMAPTSCTCRATSPAGRHLRDELPRVDADVFLVELKAAAIDVVAEEGRARGIDVVLAANDVVPVAGGIDLDYEIRRLADAVAA